MKYFSHPTIFLSDLRLLVLGTVRHIVEGTFNQVPALIHIELQVVGAAGLCCRHETETMKERVEAMGEPSLRISKLVALACAPALIGMILCGAESLRAENARNHMAVPLPPMGWSSWNSFSNTVNSQIIMDQAKAMVSNGMTKAGYRYINIDEGWWLGERDEKGNIIVDSKAWPALAPGERLGDMSNIVRYVHSLGLKAGIYTDAGANGCSTEYPDIGPGYPHTGSEGHYDQDFLQFAKWGFDYVKVDWCGGIKENLDPAVQYTEIARAIARVEAITGHRLYFSICEWGKDSPWTWAPNIGGVTADIWRTSGDIVDPIVANTKNSGRRVELKKIFSNFDQGIHPEAQHTGFYNDPDMMVIGMQGMTDALDRVHMSLWAMSGAPLLVGADLTKLSDATLATLTNRAVLAVDQDSLGLQAVKIAEPAPGLEVWSKPLVTLGQRAVLLLNRTASAALISFRLSDLGLLNSPAVQVTDLWTEKVLGTFHDSFSSNVQSGDAILLLFHGDEVKSTRYLASGSSMKLVGSGTSLSKDHPLSFAHVASRSRTALIRIDYTFHGNVPGIAELRVNGQGATRIAFPPTRDEKSPGTIWIQSVLDRSDADNILSFSAPCDPGPVIQTISIE